MFSKAIKMAPTCTAYLAHLSILIIVWLSSVHRAEAQIDKECDFPAYIRGDWFYMIDGKSITWTNNKRYWGTEEGQSMRCRQQFDHPKPVATTLGGNHTFLLSKQSENTICYHCLDILWRTQNVIQYRLGTCLSDKSGLTVAVNTSCNGVRRLPSVDEVTTMFRRSNEENINCISTFEGMYQFTYEVNYGGGGICDSLDSRIQACQDPGSKYVDNQVFRMQYAKCKDVSTSKNKQIRYQCFGTWFAMRGNIGYTFAAISDTVEKDNRERFKCLMTLKNQKDSQNKIRWVMSRFADCKSLNSIYNGPVRLVLTRIPPATIYLQPQCVLPRNITGNWLTQGPQYQSDVKVNETHLYFVTKVNQFEYQETYYSCQQSQGSRYLMTKVVVGRCEVDFTCFDITARTHSIVRFRVGKPYQYQTALQLTDPKGFLTQTFREACSWTSFTFNRDDYEWKYQTLIQNPPSPVACPIAGRYSFNQFVPPNSTLQKYQTRIRGVTEKPRVQVACRNWVTEFKSCSDTMTRIDIDAEYCESVDYRGRPIGEYDEADNILTCVGFWMEDMKSYLITWDEEDAVSSYRCWVYERKSWTGMYMSRSQNARCPREQDALSYNIDGTGLHLDLTESERLFDDCPQRFDNGANPHKKPITLWVLSGTAVPMYSALLLGLAALAATSCHYTHL